MIDVTKFSKHNIIDTCAIWNVLSSVELYRATMRASINFYCSEFVIYECLYRHRTTNKEEDKKLQQILLEERKKDLFLSFKLDIEDLQLVNILQTRKKLGLGEISSIALAIKTKQAFLTDDQRARKLAMSVQEGTIVQTVPQMFGWLFFVGILIDGDKDVIITQHQEMNGILTKYFIQTYMEACRCRLIATPSALAGK